MAQRICEEKRAIRRNREICRRAKHSNQHIVLAPARTLHNRIGELTFRRLQEVAEEKIKELYDIASKNAASLQQNKALFSEERVKKNETVQQELGKLTDADFNRTPARNERKGIQKAIFQLPPYPTTTIGSFPQTADVRSNRAAYKKGAISAEQYKTFNRKKIAECIALQERLGLDVLVHGEFERNDMVEYFGNKLDGFIFCTKPNPETGKRYVNRPCDHY